MRSDRAHAGMCSACAWDDFDCQKDPNDGNFSRVIIAALREAAHGRS